MTSLSLLPLSSPLPSSRARPASPRVTANARHALLASWSTVPGSLSSSLPASPSFLSQDMATPTQGQTSPSKEILNEQQVGKLLETEKEAAMEMHGAADIEDTDWSRAPIDVQTNYRIEKKVGKANGIQHSSIS
jgi:hypothetical protein